ncbi:MAG: hypothetical protein Q9187_007460, partial [Circinaria calcarea]
PRAIWITGPPGCGKTVLSTTINHKIREYVTDDPRCVSAFLYCEKAEENNLSVTTTLASVIAQILSQLDDIPDRISAAFSVAGRYGRSKVSSADQPMAILKDLIRPLEKAFIVVDGLDELEDSLNMSELFKELVNDTANAQLILLSRDNPNLSNRLSGLSRIALTSAVMSIDIDNYISKQLADLPLEDSGLRDQVFTKLSHTANGMFLWASLMIKTLKSATCSHEIIELLHELPIGIDVIYSSILNKLAKEPPRRRLITRRILLWICCAARPLHWNELETILAFEQFQARMVESKKPFKATILELCSSLIEYFPADDLFRPVHLSVREFLLSQADYQVEQIASHFFIQEQQGHHEIVQVCLAYQSWHNTQDPVHTSTEAYPLLEYATLFWCHHLSSSVNDSTLEQKITEFLSPQLCRRGWILRFLFWQWSIFPLQFLLKQQSLLKNWIAQGPSSQIPDHLVNWIQDIQEILLSDSNVYEDHQSHPEFLSSRIPKISYFEKLTVIRDLSRECAMSGKLTECERWLTDALDSQRRRFDADHISTVWLMNSLGIIYDQQQRVELSALTQEKALAIQESSLGTDHLETIWTINELGRVYRHLGHFEKAECMHLKALHKLRVILHPDDLQIVWTLNTLARTYRKQDRLGEAVGLHNEALAIRRKVLGETHPHTLWTMMDMAACYRQQGRLKDSAELYEKALDGRVEVLGLSHADTLWAMNNLGVVLEEMGETEPAMVLQRKALRGQINLLGPDHRHTMWTMGIVDQFEQRANGAQCE